MTNKNYLYTLHKDKVYEEIKKALDYVELEFDCYGIADITAKDLLDGLLLWLEKERT